MTCSKQFDDLSDTVFENHHQPLKVWVLCLYFMGLNLSNQQIAQKLGLNKDDTQRGKRAGSSPLQLAGVEDVPSLAELLDRLLWPDTATQPT